MNKKNYILIFMLASIANTGVATFTCWNKKNRNTNLYEKAVFKSIIEKMVVPQHAITHSNSTPKNSINHTIKHHTSTPSQAKHNRPGPVVRKIGRAPVAARRIPMVVKKACKSTHHPLTYGVQCCVCPEFSQTDVIMLNCNHTVCKSCLQRLQTPTETIQNPNNEIINSEDNNQYDIPKTLEESTAYSSEAISEVDKKLTQRYQTAIPEREPNWIWKKIGDHWYFLEDNRYWRYAQEETSNPDAEFYPKFWRYIFVSELTPRCPICRSEIKK